MNILQLKKKILKGISEDIIDLVLKKDSDYDSAFDKATDRFGDTYPVSKLYEKYLRIEKLVRTKQKNKQIEESLEDSIRDIIGYGLLWLRLKKLEEVVNRFIKIPGIGKLSAGAFIAAIGDPERFSSAKKVGSTNSLVNYKQDFLFYSMKNYLENNQC